MLTKLPTVLGVDIAITNIALDNLSVYPVDMHLNEKSHTLEDLRCITIKNLVSDMDNRKLIERKTIVKLNTHITGQFTDFIRDFLSHYHL